MGIFKKIKNEAKRVGNRVKKEIKRTDKNIKKAIENASEDLPTIIVSPLSMPTVWITESIIKEINPEFANKISKKRNELAQAILCGPGEEGKECRKQMRDGNEIEENDIKKSITQEEIAEWVDLNYDYINGAYSIIAQVSNEKDVDFDAINKIMGESRNCHLELRRVSKFAKEYNLLLPKEYEKIAKRAELLIAMMEEDLVDLQIQ